MVVMYMPTPVRVWLPGRSRSSRWGQSFLQSCRTFLSESQSNKGEVKGNIPILDIQYGNVWSNISDELLNQAGIKLNDTLCVTISEGSQQKYAGKMPYVASFGDVPEGQPMVYLNSLLNVSVALNMDNFAQKHQVASGADWNIDVKKCAK